MYITNMCISNNQLTKDAARSAHLRVCLQRGGRVLLIRLCCLELPDRESLV